MTQTDGAAPLRHLKTAEAARFLGLSHRTMEKHRCYGTGPVYRKIGGRVVYAMDDLLAWARRGARTSTHDPNAQIVPPARRPVAPAPPLGAQSGDGGEP
ncbi:helix-turn-helix transcriptional regulator [Caulobacter endophyticus]|uniref:DNA-binding protein n=1 Tax=Caulobacter endophyticus TaxID=2172652 RepID=A0A2T9JEG3_9CAUL|nr:helix-turn-helix domain-containing protein [Caulobacter endophyticus]PVM82091.1 DNA-binding protein [Caulobacter endophyticus]